MNNLHQKALENVHVALDGLDVQDACIILTYVLCEIVKGMGEDKDFLIRNTAKQYDLMKKPGGSLQ